MRIKVVRQWLPILMLAGLSFACNQNAGTSNGGKTTQEASSKKQHDVYFELTATGEKNPKSKGKEVWLLRFPKIESLLASDSQKAWIHRGNELHAVGDKESTITFTGSLDSPYILLGRHDWSGIARVKTISGTKTYDLYGSGNIGVYVGTAPAPLSIEPSNTKAK